MSFIDDKIRSLDFLKVRILIPDPFSHTVEGIMVDDTFTIDTSAQWSNALEDFNLANLLGEKLGALASAAATAFGINKKLVQQTTSIYGGPEKQEFSIGLMFYSTTGYDHPERNAAILTSALQPTFKLGSTVMEAPLDYEPFVGVDPTDIKVNGSSASKGTCALSIGKWFSASGLLLKNASFEMSRECNSVGSPLFVTGKVTFEVYRAVERKEFMGFYNLGGSSGESQTSSIKEG